MTRSCWHRFVIYSFCALAATADWAAPSDACAAELSGTAAARRGYELLTTKAYLPPDFDQEAFDAVWQTWEEPLRTQAAAATVAERRRMAFERYGLTSAPGDDSARPQQYVVDERGNWTMNCLACHQGKVAGRVIPGVPNSLYALETLTEEIRATKIRLGKKLSRMDVGLLVIPLGTTNGTTNAVSFGVGLLARRDPDLRFIHGVPPQMVHHDHDAPAWWHMHGKQRLYADDFADRSPRALMQFMLVPENGPEKFREWEADFECVAAWIESLRPPPYPFAVDRQLAATGAVAFRRHCASCHGTYGVERTYPEKIVSIDRVGTDRARFDALTPAHRKRYAATWFNYYRTDAVIADPAGYVAPPLDGIWATAPYFHNGSVPTLWHLLHTAERPLVWTRTPDGYDQQRVGLDVRTFAELPTEAQTSRAARRRYFDTSAFGKSAVGHDFPDALSEPEKQAVLEYLKTL